MQDSARELLCASASDADAVRRYLQQLGPEELQTLLDGVAPRGAKCGKDRAVLVRDDWLPLVHVLLHCDHTRLRAASRIVQLLRRGAPSELESMQLLTEVSAGYAGALDELQEAKRTSRVQHAVRRKKLLEELDVLLNVVFSFLSEVVQPKSADSKVLPQLLGLVPYFLGMLNELGEAVSEHLAKLLELPWSCYTVPSLLDVLVDDSSLMARESWKQLQENVARMVTNSPELANDTMNPISRTCVLVSSVTGDHEWIGIARYLLRQLPLHLRQEAEFNLQMSLQQSPRIVSLVCDSIRFSQEDDTVMGDANDPADISAWTSSSLAPDWCDLFLLLHSLQASKPILHHRTSSSRVATDASVFDDIQKLSWWIVESDAKAFTTTASISTAKAIDKHICECVEQLLNFGGKQIHAREWKALLLMDIAFFWIEQSASIDHRNKSATSKPSIALLLLLAIFQKAPEARSEVLSCLFERAQKPTQRKIAGETLAQLFTSQAGALFPHLNAIQDWLGVQFQRSTSSARYFFLIASRLATVHTDLYNFLMVFLRKLLSSGNRVHQEFAVDMWCTWLDHGLPFNEQQEEEIIAAVKNSMTVCHDIQAWSFGRLEQVFHLAGSEITAPTVSLHKTSWEELHRFLFHEVAKFIQPTPLGLREFNNERDDDSADEFEDQNEGLSRFRFCSLDGFYRQNSSLDGAAVIGLVFQKLLSCLISFEKAASRAKVSSDGLQLELSSERDGDLKLWLAELVTNWKFFFHWICQGSEEILNQSSRRRVDKSAWWQLLARAYIGCAICNVSIEMLLWDDDDGAAWSPRLVDNDITIWSLMEIEFSLHRMLHKLAAQCAAETETNLSKEYLRSASYGLHRVLQPKKLKILRAVMTHLQSTDMANDRPGGLSFESVIFVLDSCDYGLEGPSRYESFFPDETTKDNRLGGATSVLEVLISLYLCLRDRVLAMCQPSSTEATGAQQVASTEDTEADPTLCFSVYSDSISSKFPKAARYLLAPAKTAKTVVLLDARAGEEILEHICAAISRALDVMKATNARSANDHLAVLLQRMSSSGQTRQLEDTPARQNNFLGLSRCFLRDVKECVQVDGLSKLGIACAALSARLSDIGAEITDDSGNLPDYHALSSAAYDIMCDNVVYNKRLLRLLLRICLSTHLAQQLSAFVKLDTRIDGFIQACGLDTTADAVASSKPDRTNDRSRGKQREGKGFSLGRRKRLRHEMDARSSYGLTVDSDSEASYSSDSDDSVRYASTTPADANDDKEAVFTQARLPHLDSQVSQDAALLAVMAVLEQSLSTLLNAIAAKSSGKLLSFPRRQDILRYIRTHELVNKAISENIEFSCGNRRVLLKMLHMIELGLRIGKTSGALRRAEAFDRELSHETATCLFASAVSSALRSRVWIDAIKDASQDSGTKARVSATLLKMDVFFLQVPGTVQSWMKESALDDASRDRLKALVASVKERIAPEQANAGRGKAKARPRLVGVVPIVKKRRKRLRSRHPIIDAFLNEENGADAFADLEDFIE